ncbi:hypothetical protein K461DRAFT_266991 [Myriangium duriaei CBS 260.36]|uniref:2'-5' RNA ligase family protein n=1 Tax=Myriangium duriaei CBS 260.36 TaxID=1168546 RepID=A0A9P4J3K7_9PEZI|nr:hypothetical protein K461DRAFT_266991 [Myriangium duriaei CBS 260.36]
MGYPQNSHANTQRDESHPSNRRNDNAPGNSSSDTGDHVRQRSPSQQPQNSHSNEQMYILTLLTNEDLHVAMNDLRKKYFPPELNRLEAHITLFHALPQSQLESKVMPAIDDLVQKTSPFRLGATTPFKLRKGIAIGMPKDHGGNTSRQVHRTLARRWQDFLSQQDQSFQAHFTIMNKVDESERVDRAFQEIQNGWKPYFGTAEGLSLWKYHAGNWEFVKDFRFVTK